ncbi:MAG: RluA family pseudouridine synthase [Clostridia bacterium]|nr:RluA family pseudouridine synthase [Clostridia bacterium]MDD4375858.1 RluA family pseudouridine synthase [Clostridia bacterium]
MKKYKNIKIIYEDNHVLVVIKPAKIPSQPDKTKDIDMLSILKEYLKKEYNKPGDVYLGLVHRLDRMTEGLMVFAKTSKAASRLSKNIREGDFKKRYIALVWGKINKSDDIIKMENYLIKDEKNNTSRVIKEKGSKAKLAKLSYKIINYTKINDEDYTYVEIKLETGRHHQIRVQFANIDHPLYGDIKYSKIKRGNKLALYAYSLSFFHPTKDEVMEFDIIPTKDEIWGDLKEWKKMI